MPYLIDNGVVVKEDMITSKEMLFSQQLYIMKTNSYLYAIRILLGRK